MWWALYSGSGSAAGNGSTLANGHPNSPMCGDTTVTAGKEAEHAAWQKVGGHARTMSSRPFNFRVMSVRVAHATWVVRTEMCKLEEKTYDTRTRRRGGTCLETRGFFTVIGSLSGTNLSRG